MDKIYKKITPVRHTMKFSVIVVICISILLFDFLNLFEPQIDSQLDFFELMFVLGYVVTSIYALVIAKRYWGSKIFGRAYLSLGIAVGCNAIGAALFDFYQMYSEVVNPYPYYPDIFFIAYYPFAIYHIQKNVKNFRPKLKKSQKTLIIVLPLVLTSIYAFGLLVPVNVSGSVPDLLSQQVTIGDTTFLVTPTTPDSTNQHIMAGNITYDLLPLTIDGSTTYPQIYDPQVRSNLLPIVFKTATFDPILDHDQQFWNGFFVGIFFVAATGVTFAWAIVGAQTFRGSVLGAPWGLLLVGIGLNTIGNLTYYYTSIYTYDRSNPIIGIWILGTMIVFYALYLHKKHL